jgi:hypothetical protein
MGNGLAASVASVAMKQGHFPEICAISTNANPTNARPTHDRRKTAENREICKALTTHNRRSEGASVPYGTTYLGELNDTSTGADHRRTTGGRP